MFDVGGGVRDVGCGWWSDGCGVRDVDGGARDVECGWWGEGCGGVGGEMYSKCDRV